LNLLRLGGEVVRKPVNQSVRDGLKWFGRGLKMPGMNPIELMADVMTSNLGVLKMTLADFSDADMLVRPAPKANHAAWQLGHLVTAENNMLRAVAPEGVPALPEGFAQKFTKEAAANNDRTAFPTKAETLEAYEKTRAAAAQWVRGLAPADLDKPGPERLRHLAPTWGHLALLIPSHTTMHLGQFQVIRRALGKPVLF
jgi:hypothetical protein